VCSSDLTENWSFFGDKTGYVAVRIQESGLYKLAVVGGNIRGILKGMQELLSLNKPTWGMVSKDILPIVKKLGFKTPNVATMNVLLRLIPKSVFGGVDFKINPDGSITLKYSDVGNATKYFVGNEAYFNYLKNQIKDKINPLKLVNLLREIVESKQVSDLYHFTPSYNLKKILSSQYLSPNDEGQISTSIRANMDTEYLFSDTGTRNPDSIARLMLDGNKISTKYKVGPFSYNQSSDGGHGEDLGEEQIIVNGRNFYFLPYLKRIDIFTGKKNTSKTKKEIDNIIPILDKMNIPYKIYDGTPLSNIPYKQPKEGDPSNIEYTPRPKEIVFSNKDLKYPFSSYKTYSLIFPQEPEKDEVDHSADSQPLRFPYTRYFMSESHWIDTPDFPGYYVNVADIHDFEIFNDYKKDHINSYKDLRIKELLNSMVFKSWSELGMKEKYEQIEKKYEKLSGRKFGVYYDDRHKGLIMIPKNIADKYLAKKSSKSYIHTDTIIPKK
jgi:hypothetical protein